MCDPDGAESYGTLKTGTMFKIFNTDLNGENRKKIKDHNNIIIHKFGFRVLT